jgi:hypothetical protein
VRARLVHEDQPLAAKPRARADRHAAPLGPAAPDWLMRRPTALTIGSRRAGLHAFMPYSLASGQHLGNPLSLVQEWCRHYASVWYGDRYRRTFFFALIV